MTSVPFLLTAALTALSISACVDESGPPPFTCDEAFVVTSYRIDALDLPRTAQDADRVGTDLDGDRTVDNHLGNAISAVIGAFDAEDAYLRQLDQRVAGGLDWQLELQTCPATGESRAALRDDLLPLGALTDFRGGADEGWFAAELAVVEVEIVDGAIQGTVALGLPSGYAPVIARSYAPFANAQLARGQDDAGFDRDGNGEITEAEVLRSELFATLTRPDLDTDGDDAPDLYSFGFGFHATAIAPAP